MKPIPVSEAKARLTELVRASDDEDVVLMRYGRPAAVLMSSDRYEALMARLEDLEDSLAVADAQGEKTESASEAFARIGLVVPERT